jgi:DNA helicase-2/ATP-dependent DNA helicase PcrA
VLDEVIKQQIENRIEVLHCGDEKQLEVIFSDAQRLLVEAPAGYGKTKTMISKIAYMLACNELPNPKKILALTFSVNAAYKIKKDVAEQLPSMICLKNFYPVKVNEKVYISNYHGFSRHILKLYGYLIHEKLRNIDILKSVDDSDVKTLYELNIGLDVTEAEEISYFNLAVKNIDTEYIKANWNKYVEKIKTKFLPNSLIPYNAILILAIELLSNYESISSFYQNYFPVIIVDEFQDTNILSWKLLKLLITDKSKIIFMGDSLQRIYGFIGAIPNLMARVEKALNMKRIELAKNYRFKDNPEMLLLDKNIRLNAENVMNPAITRNAKIPFVVKDNQEDEVNWVCNKIKELLRTDVNTKIAVLVKQRSNNVDMLISELQNQGIDYFFGLFKDDDPEYLYFHRVCAHELSEYLKNDIGRRVSKAILDKMYIKIKEYFKDKRTATIESLLVLLKVFLDKIVDEYSFLSTEDKITFIRDTFENNVLKQHMENINKNVILSTIHGAKGLEWPYVIMPDMEQFVFPSYYSLCGMCNFDTRMVQGTKCILTNPKKVEEKFLEELSVFYVGVTRARKQVFFSSSKERIDYQGNSKRTYISCMLNRPGIEYSA